MRSTLMRARGGRAWSLMAGGYRAGRAALGYIDLLAQHLVDRSRLPSLRDRHRDERCFVIGNGPSLRGRDLSALAGEVTFVTNHFYFHPQLQILRPTYYCASDLSFFAADHPDWPTHLSLLPAATVFFLPLEVRRRVRASSMRGRWDVHYVRCRRTREIWRLGSMPVDVTRTLWTGDSVIIDFCLPLAHFLGFSEVYLLGCDTDYGVEGNATHFYDAHTRMRSRRYHREAWYENVTRSYTIARRRFEADGRRIYNATAGGRLEVFPRVTLEDVLDPPRTALSPRLTAGAPARLGPRSFEARR